MKLVAYVRVSTDEQAREGVSLGMQESRIRAWCEAMDHELVGVYRDEGASAASLERPAFREVLEACESAGVDGLVVLKLDRMTRSGRDFYFLIDRFEQLDKAIVSVQDNLDTKSPSGRLVANIMVAVSQWERETISERTKDALHELREQGVRLGRAQLGRTQRGEWLSAEWEHAFDEALYLRGKGASFERIAGELGLRPDGRVWRWQAVQSLLNGSEVLV